MTEATPPLSVEDERMIRESYRNIRVTADQVAGLLAALDATREQLRQAEQERDTVEQTSAVALDTMRLQLDRMGQERDEARRDVRDLADALSEWQRQFDPQSTQPSQWPHGKLFAHTTTLLAKHAAEPAAPAPDVAAY